MRTDCSQNPFPGRPDFCLRTVQDKLDRADRLVTQLVRLQSPATALILHPLCLGRCQISCHARTMPPVFSFKKLPRWNHPSSHHRAQASIKAGGFGIRDPVLHSRTARMGSFEAKARQCWKTEGFLLHRSRRRRVSRNHQKIKKETGNSFRSGCAMQDGDKKVF